MGRERINRRTDCDGKILISALLNKSWCIKKLSNYNKTTSRIFWGTCFGRQQASGRSEPRKSGGQMLCCISRQLIVYHNRLRLGWHLGAGPRRSHKNPTDKCSVGASSGISSQLRSSCMAATYANSTFAL